MTEVQNRNTNGTSDATNAKKRKGFWPNIFSRSNAADADEKKDDQEPKRKGGLMNSLMNNARQAATKEVAHVAEVEGKHEIEALLHNNNGSQPTNTTTTTANAAPDTTTTTPSDALNAPTNWAKRMVDSAQQKMQGLQSLGS